MVTRRRTAIQRTIRSRARACIIQANKILGDQSTLLDKIADATYCLPKRTGGRNNPRTRRKKTEKDDGMDMGPDPAEMERLMGAIDDAEDFELVFERVKPETYVYNGKVKKGNVVDACLNGSQSSDTTIKTATIEHSVIYSDRSSVGSRSIAFPSPSLENNKVQNSVESDQTLVPDEDTTTAFSNKENFVPDTSLTSRSPSTKKRRTLSMLEEDLLEISSINDDLMSSQGSTQITESESTSNGCRTPPEDIPDDPAINDLIERTAARPGRVPDAPEVRKTTFLYDAEDRLSDADGEISSVFLEENSNVQRIAGSDRTKSFISMTLNESGNMEAQTKMISAVMCNVEQTISKSFDTIYTRHIARCLRSVTKKDSIRSKAREDCDVATCRTYDSVEIGSRLTDVDDVLESSNCIGRISDGSHHSTELKGNIDSTLTQQIKYDGCVVAKETSSLQKSKTTRESPREHSLSTASSTKSASSASQSSVVCSSPCLNSTQASTLAILQLDQSPILSQSSSHCDTSYQRPLCTCRTLSVTMFEKANASKNDASTPSKSRLSLFVKSCNKHSQSRRTGKSGTTFYQDNNISFEIQGASTPVRIPDSTIQSIRPDASTILRGKQSVLSIRSEADFYLEGYLGNKDDFVSQLMFICKQSGFLEFDDYIKRFIGPSKLGEGTFGEVFQATLDGKTVALKIIPFVRSDDDIIELNGDYTKPAENVLPELLISKELSDLSENSCNQTSGFVKVHDAKVVRGNWPKSLLTCWNGFKKKFPKKCLNTFPGEYMDPEKVYYLLIALGHGGSDLESVSEQKKLKSKEQVVSVLVQICLTLVIAESSLEFEHRDLHWGNVLVKMSGDTKEVITYVYEGDEIQLRTYGYRVSLIDFTNSRIRSDHTTIYLNLGADKELFEGKGEDHKGGDYQFDIYRMMKDSNDDEWSHFNPKSNCFWIHYLAKKIVNAMPRYPKAQKMELLSIFDKVLEVDSLNDFILLPEVDRLFKDYIVDE